MGCSQIPCGSAVPRHPFKHINTLPLAEGDGSCCQNTPRTVPAFFSLKHIHIVQMVSHRMDRVGQLLLSSAVTSSGSTEWACPPVPGRLFILPSLGSISYRSRRGLFQDVVVSLSLTPACRWMVLTTHPQQEEELLSTVFHDAVLLSVWLPSADTVLPALLSSKKNRSVSVVRISGSASAEVERRR